MAVAPGGRRGMRIEKVGDDMEWTELAERKGMRFAILTGDPKTGQYTQLTQGPGRN